MLDPKQLVTFGGGCAAGFFPRSVLALSNSLGFAAEGNPLVPVCLQRGGPAWGFEHIRAGHLRGLREKIVGKVHSVNDEHVVPAALWMRLRIQSGVLYDLLDDSKGAVFMSQNTSTVVVFRRELILGVDACSVTTMYVRDRPPEGMRLGRVTPRPALLPAQRVKQGPLPDFGWCAPEEALWAVESGYSLEDAAADMCVAKEAEIDLPAT